MNFPKNLVSVRRAAVTVMTLAALSAATNGAAAAAAAGDRGAAFIDSEIARRIALQICLQRSKVPQACELIQQAETPAQPVSPVRPHQPCGGGNGQRAGDPSARVPTPAQCMRAYRANCPDPRAYCG